MAAVRAHHVDIKEPNILYDVDCSTDKSNRQVTAGRLRRLGGCQVRFALSDFGLIMLDPRRSTPTDSGTPGFRSPLMYDNYHDFRNDYMSFMWHTAPGSPEDVWRSYEAARDSPVTRVRTATAKSRVRTGVTKSRRQQQLLLLPKLTGAQRFEKNDLYALGVMLMYFDYDQDRRTRPINDLGVALVMGPRFRGSIMTIDHAIESYRKVRAALSGSERRLDLRTLRHLDDDDAGDYDDYNSRTSSR
jgi:serine/threonine protein kinase